VHAVADLGDNLTKAAGTLREGPRGCVTERLFDAELVRARRTKTAVAAAEGADLLLRWAADELAFRVAGVKRVFPDALMLGSHGSPCPALALSAMDNVGRIVRADSIFVPYAARPDPAQRGAMPSGTARQPERSRRRTLHERSEPGRRRNRRSQTACSPQLRDGVRPPNPRLPIRLHRLAFIHDRRKVETSGQGTGCNLCRASNGHALGQ
jgi:hypothetical protein